MFPNMVMHVVKDFPYLFMALLILCNSFCLCVCSGWYIALYICLRKMSIQHLLYLYERTTRLLYTYGTNFGYMFSLFGHPRHNAFRYLVHCFHLCYACMYVFVSICPVHIYFIILVYVVFSAIYVTIPI